MSFFQNLVEQQKTGIPVGMYSCCSSSELVLRAAVQRAKQNNVPVLIEATANQVNQFGGYTGMQPEDFCAFVRSIAREYGLREENVLLGGDHLGPLTWAQLQEDEAMSNAVELVTQFVLAGFTKIHLDTSMRLGSDSRDERLPDSVIAKRSATLCKAAEAAYRQRCKTNPKAAAPVYVIGSEVPIPGGAQEAEESISITRPQDCMGTYNTFARVFREEGLEDAWKRVVAMVVQPGVEFGETEIFPYVSEAAAPLITCLKQLPLVFEGHSTDYQTPEALRAMVQDGIAILKVGPALTFALREGLFALEAIEKEMLTGTGTALSCFREVLEYEMLKHPQNWQKHYHGDGVENRFSRAFSFSDRTRYYLPNARVERAVERLCSNLSSTSIPLPLISQYMPSQYPKVRSGVVANTPTALLLDRVGDRIDDYYFATMAQ